uniref:Uncharacterized protein n=1 Tax=Arundo donax TaxID=35708 RepID=A0A0A9AWJ3_ARUDO
MTVIINGNVFFISLILTKSKLEVLSAIFSFFWLKNG